MPKAVDRVTRVAADLVDSAAAEGARQSRSAKQQLDHWARVVQGDRGDALRGEHVAVVGSRQALLDSCGDLGVEHHALLQRQVRHRQMPRERSFHAAPRRRVLVRHRPTDAGDIVEHRPDGTSVVLAATP